MKYTIEGFSQKYALSFKKTVPYKDKEKTIKLDFTDLVILRWFVDFYPNMRKMSVDGREYAILTHNKLLSDLPLLDITKRACIERMQKLVEFEILDYQLVKEGGTFSLYTFGKNYINLVRSTDTGVAQSTNAGGIRSTDTGGGGQPANKDNSIIDIELENKIIYIVEYLNKKVDAKYRPDTKGTVKLLTGLLTGKNPYTVEDCIKVIDNQCAKWKGTEWEQYLRPSTLFGTKFENYLNGKVTKNNSAQYNEKPPSSERDYGKAGIGSWD